MQRREAEIGRRDRKCHQRSKNGTIPAKIPTETARFESAWKSAVRKNRMVVCAVGYEPVSTEYSLLSGKLTGNFAIFRPLRQFCIREVAVPQRFFTKFPKKINRVKLSR